MDSQDFDRYICHACPGSERRRSAFTRGLDWSIDNSHSDSITLATARFLYPQRPGSHLLDFFSAPSFQAQGTRFFASSMSATPVCSFSIVLGSGTHLDLEPALARAHSPALNLQDFPLLFFPRLECCCCYCCPRDRRRLPRDERSPLAFAQATRSLLHFRSAVAVQRPASSAMAKSLAQPLSWLSGLKRVGLQATFNDE